jgi:hypothetical protein
MMSRSVARSVALGPRSPATPAFPARLLEEITAVARRLDGSAEMGEASGYVRRLLHEDPAGWSLTAAAWRAIQPRQQVS